MLARNADCLYPAAEREGSVAIVTHSNDNIRARAEKEKQIREEYRAHTPGPWECHPTSHHSHDYRLSLKHGPMPARHPGEDSSEAHNARARANAHVIAAAPELLSALEAIAARIVGDWDNPALVAFGPLTSNTSDDTLTIARAAIARAKGGAA